MTIIKNENYVEEALDLLLEQFKNKAYIEALLSSYVTQIQLSENANYDVWYNFLIDNANDAQLDVLGIFVGEVRRSVDNDEYRIYIKARIAINRSSGKIPEILAILQIIAPSTDTYELRETGNASFVVEALRPGGYQKLELYSFDNCVFANTSERFIAISDTPIVTPPAYIQSMLDIVKDIKSGGVKVQLLWANRDVGYLFQTASGDAGKSDKLIPTTDNDTHFAWQGVMGFTTSIQYELSAIASKDEYDDLWLELGATAFPGNPRGIFNLTSGTVAYSNDVDAVTIEQLDDNRYKCTIYATADATALDFGGIGLADGIGLIFAGDGTSGLHVSNAWLSVAGDDTNMFTYPNELNNAAWVKTRLESVVANDATYSDIDKGFSNTELTAGGYLMGVIE